MKAGLTEIGSASLTSIDKHWEYKHNERLVAAIQIEASGQARFDLDARQISVTEKGEYKKASRLGGFNIYWC